MDFPEALRVDRLKREFAKLVWIVYPKHQLVHVYESPTALRGLSRSDRLTGGNVIPGFELPLAELFPEAIE